MHTGCLLCTLVLNLCNMCCVVVSWLFMNMLYVCFKIIIMYHILIPLQYYYYVQCILILCCMRIILKSHNKLLMKMQMLQQYRCTCIDPYAPNVS